MNKQISLEELRSLSEGTMVSHLGIEFTETGEDYIKARMPVDSRTRQPMNLLHGGASLALAETLGSIASNLLVDQNKYYCVGMEINANHIHPVNTGWVYGIARPVHLGKKSHVWDIRISNEEDKLVCISRLTVAVIEK
ncbi:MAG TPA: hotdog fold thioesterase [Cyclobacteriaceae bacterium]|nr:hotdog fold thioesterase [Cyclobacteriaceae bacterium]